ncbi:MAG: hypothetical protein ACC645_28125, partial [Pirellulales bacterium]
MAALAISVLRRNRSRLSRRQRWALLTVNAIVFTGKDRTLGVGAGQMSRVDSCRLAVWKAEQAGLSLKGSVVASDAMFPFPDGLVGALEAGATSAIQPGGSIRD